MTSGHAGTSTRDDSVAMRHMLDRTREVAAMVSGRSRTDLNTDRVMQLAISCLIEMVGDVASRVSREARTRHPDIPWDEVIVTGNRMIQEYDTVDYDRVWRIVTQEFPLLIAALERALAGQRS